MTPPNILLPIAIVVLSWAAGYLDGCEEADKINDRIARGDKRELTHWWEWTVRVVFLAVGLFFLYLINDWFGFTQWTLVGYAGMAFGVFVPTHRYFVNTRRANPFSLDLRWLHMGPLLQYRKKGDAVYDHLWHWIAWVVSGARKVTMNDVLTDGKIGSSQIGHHIYPPSLPAKLAYAFELLVALSSLVLVTAQLWM